MVDYFEVFGSAAPDFTQRAVGVHLPGGTTVAAGASVTVNLSSLDFTRDETTPTWPSSRRVAWSSAAPQSTRRTPPPLDEVGKASVTFTVPATASGPTTFDVSVPSTGTTSSFTLNVTP